MNISDDLRPGRPTISDGATRVQVVILEDKRHSVRDIADITELSMGNVHNILTTQLEMNKVNAQWVQLEVFILKRNERLGVSIALINRRCKKDVPKCSVPLCHHSFIGIL